MPPTAAAGAASCPVCSSCKYTAMNAGSVTSDDRYCQNRKQDTWSSPACSSVASECTSTAVGVLHTNIITSTSKSVVAAGKIPACKLPSTTAIPISGCSSSLLMIWDMIRLGGTWGLQGF
eukprot:GHUV01036632.1.p1 GENE.GHUV01036632.1~~GHUV01036632.1.p1  ORF type:complete len:120 (-),score=22.95 GHUV01036632.1:398-757(-)